MIEHRFDRPEIHSYDFDIHMIELLAKNPFVKDNWPVIYIISNEIINEAYVGESTNAISRMGHHLNNPERQKLNKLHIISSGSFNKSAGLDIESSLIKYMSADGKYKLQNGNGGLSNHNYYLRPEYARMFKTLWAELQKENITVNSLNKIDNSDLFKYSPYKSLSFDQTSAVAEILKFLSDEKKTSFLANGGSGTGKTILAVYLMKLLANPDLALSDDDSEEQDELNSLINLLRTKQDLNNYKVGFVVPMTSLRKTIKKVFKNVKGLSSGMVIGPADVTKRRYDLLIVDESHRLHRRKGITNYGAFDQGSRKLGLDPMKTNELEWILNQSDKQIFFYDALQSVRPSDIERKAFDSLTKKRTTVGYELSSQMRVKGGTDYVSFVHKLLDSSIESDSKKFSSDSYELIHFDSIRTLRNELTSKEKEYGLCRLVAGFAWDWVTKNDPDGFDIDIQGLQLKWNSTNEDWINSEHAFNEVGCIHSTQGYDLNYVGVIFGPEIVYDSEKKRIRVIRSAYRDPKGKFQDTEDRDLHDYIVNVYKTLMLRGILGTFVYACDENLSSYLKRHINSNTDT